LSDLDRLQRGTSPREAMEARLLIEPELASLAAVNATAQQIEAMRTLAGKMREAHSWAAYELHDGQLHNLIANAAGNKLLAAVHYIVPFELIDWSRRQERSPSSGCGCRRAVQHKPPL
jgi:DNA-binding FadR family transcriptional regulator